MDAAKKVRTKRNPVRLVPAGLRIEDAARYIGVSVATLKILAETGKAPRGLKLGACRVWPRRDLAEWLEAGAPEMREWNARKEMAKQQRRFR